MQLSRWILSLHHLSRHSKTYTLLKGVDGSEIKLKGGCDLLVKRTFLLLVSEVLWLQSDSAPVEDNEHGRQRFCWLPDVLMVERRENDETNTGGGCQIRKNAQRTTRRRRRLHLLANSLDSEALPTTLTLGPTLFDLQSSLLISSATNTSCTIYCDDDQHDDHYSQII
jgi:hypothetical protein